MPIANLASGVSDRRASSDPKHNFLVINILRFPACWNELAWREIPAETASRYASMDRLDALQISIKAPMVLPDPEGCSPLQPRERNIVPSGFGSAEGPGSLYVPIKV